MFFDAQGRTLETLSFGAAYCVGYQEFFASGDADGGAYQCRVTLSDPHGWHWRPGGPSAQALLQNPFGLPPPVPTPPPIPTPPLLIEVPVPPSSLGLLARLLALLPEAGVAAAIATLLPTNSPDDPGYQSEWDLIRRYTPPTDKDRAELADLERRHAEDTLTPEEEAHLLALLARVKGLHLQQLADLRTLPSRPPDPSARPRGPITKINPRNDRVTQDGLRRENESAALLAQAGYEVEQNPNIPGTRKKPDYIVEGLVFDCYAPNKSNPRAIWSSVTEKIEEEQTQRIILNLDDSSVDMQALRDQFNNYPIPNLKEVIIIKQGQISHLLP